MIKKTYIPGKPRNPKLGTATGTSGVGKTEFNQVAGSSHEHSNKGVLDRITEAMLVGALRDLITSTDTESELTDENILSALRVLSEISKANADFLEDIKAKFLSKIEPDTAQKLIKFVEGVEVGTFTTGALGSGAAIKMLNGTSYAEVDHLLVRQKATFIELVIESLKHVGGQLILSPARMKCVDVVDGGSYYKCFFDNDGGAISNEFVAGDQARCQVFTGSGTKFYWRLVTSVGDDWINLSKTDAVSGSDIPEAGDDIVQLGNRNDTTRQSAIILSTIGDDAPSWKQYSGINSFDLANKETTVFTRLGNRIQGKTVFTSGGTNLEDVLDGVSSDIQDTQAAVNNLQIGGVNLINGNTESIFINVPDWVQIPLSSNLVVGETYILGGTFRIDTGTGGVIGLNNNDYGVDYISLPLNTPFVANSKMASKTHFCLAKQMGDSSLIVSAIKVQLENGNKKTTWNQAPEYIQSRIEAAKQEALTAAGNAQTTADSLKDFTDTAFRDGIIDRSESIAIEKYKNSLNEAMSKAEASYKKVSLNTYLPEGAAKTSLLDAKINLWGQRDTLLSAINTAISGGTTTPAQKTAVDNAFSTFNNLMTEFQNALEEANKAIQAKLEWFTANSQVGGNNLSGSISQYALGAGWTRNGETLSNLTTSTFNHCSSPNFNLIAGKTYILSFEVDEIVGDGRVQVITNSTNTTLRNVKVGVGKSSLLITSTVSEVAHIRVYGYTSTRYIISNIKLNEAITDRVEKVKLTAEEAQAKAQALEYLKQAIGQDAVIDGALYTLVTLLLKEDMNAQVTAFFSGIQGANKNLPAIGIGAHTPDGNAYTDAIAGLAKIIFRHDGTGKIGVFEVDEIGSVKIYDPDIADLLRLEFVKSKVPTVASLLSQTEAGQSKTNTARMFYSSSGSATLPNSVTVTEEGAELSFQGMMELYADFSELNGATFGSAYVGVALYKDGFNYATLGGISSGQLNKSNSYYSNFVQLNKKLTVPKGVYTIVVSASFNNALGSAGINNTSTLSWILRKDIRKFIFGSDGFASWYTENSFHFSELTGMFARGKVDIPAGLGGGRVTAGGGVNTPWGLVTGGARASNVVTINHNIGDTRYTVNVALNGNSSPWYFQNRTNTSIQVVCSGAFDFTLIRTPV